jgi:hypothetical protein
MCKITLLDFVLEVCTHHKMVQCGKKLSIPYKNEVLTPFLG